MKKITSREKIILIAAFIIIAVVLFENLFSKPLRDDMAQLDKDIAKRQEIIFGLQSQERGYESITNDLERARNEYNTAIGQLPPDWDGTMMLRYIEDTIGENILKNSLVYNGLKEYSNYSVGSYTISVTGLFEDIINLFYKFEDAEYYNTITAVSMPKYSYENEEVTSTFTINFYVLNDKE